MTFDFHIGNITGVVKGLFDIMYIAKVAGTMIPFVRYKIIWWFIENPEKINIKKGEPKVN